MVGRYNVSVSAIDLCGQESEPLTMEFEVEVSAISCDTSALISVSVVFVVIVTLLIILVICIIIIIICCYKWQQHKILIHSIYNWTSQ